MRISRSCVLVAVVVLGAACSNSAKPSAEPVVTTTAPSGTATTTTTAPPTTTEQEAGMTSGLPFADPPDANAATNNVRFTLNAEQAEVDVAGRQAWAETYNRTYVGPTI